MGTTESAARTQNNPLTIISIISSISRSHAEELFNWTTLDWCANENKFFSSVTNSKYWSCTLEIQLTKSEFNVPDARSSRSSRGINEEKLRWKLS